MKQGTHFTVRLIFPTIKRTLFGARCARSTPPRGSSNGNGSTPRHLGPGCFRRQAGSSSLVTRRETLSRWKRLPAECCGTSSVARRSFRHQCRLPSTENSTWSLRRALLFSLFCFRGDRRENRGDCEGKHWLCRRHGPTKRPAAS